MAKQWTKTVVAAAVGSAMAGWGGVAGASGFQLQEQGASGLGVAYSGQAAAVHDASTAFWNPAGMSLLPGKQVTGALHYIIPDTKFTSAGPLPGGSTYNALGNGGQGGESAFVPALYGTWMINPQWTVGLAVNAPFGLATEWDNTWAGQFHAIRSEIKTLNINPTVAFKVNNMISLGAGLSYQRMEAELTNAVSPLVPGSVGKVEGDDWAWGWNLGALFDFGQGTRLGLTYRSTIDYTIEGDLTFSGIALPSQQVKADVELPDTFSIGVSHQFNPKLRVLADYTWTGWDSIQQLVIQNRGSGATISTTELRFENSWRVGVGLEYQLNQPWLLRAGLAYDTSPVQDAFRTPRLPDNDRTWLAIGARYQPAPNWWLDFGYTYIWVDDASSNLTPAGAVPGTLVGTYKANVQILGAQASIRF
jgi:long-chain fatty acid transport protein